VRVACIEALESGKRLVHFESAIEREPGVRPVDSLVERHVGQGSAAVRWTISIEV
jgi:hypothetical protein